MEDKILKISSSFTEHRTGLQKKLSSKENEH